MFKSAYTADQDIIVTMAAQRANILSEVGCKLKTSKSQIELRLICCSPASLSDCCPNLASLHVFHFAHEPHSLCPFSNMSNIISCTAYDSQSTDNHQTQVGAQECAYEQAMHHWARLQKVKAACAVCRDHQASTLQDLLQNYCLSAYHTCVQQSISCAELNDSYQFCHQGAVKQNTQQQRTCSKQTSDRLSHHSEMTSSPISKQIQSEPCTA